MRAERVVVIQCGSRKLDYPAAAREFYTGIGYFIDCRRLAERLTAHWYIVSAKYGLVRPGQLLRPYNQSLPASGDPAWGERVRQDLVAAEPEGWQRLIALCGERYCVGWADELKAERPLRGLTIGKRRAVLIRALHERSGPLWQPEQSSF